MEVNEAIGALGFCGRWQILIFSLIQVAVKTPFMWQVVSVVWIGYRPPHHCKVPGNSSVLEWVPSDSSGKLSSCSIYTSPFNNHSLSHLPSLSNLTTTCVEGWDFDVADSGPTVVSKWELVCERAYLMQTSQTVFTIGLAASALFTKVSDKFGRRRTMIMGSFLESLFGLSSAFVDRLELFFAARFFIGFFMGVVSMSCMVYISESFDMKTRPFYFLMGLAFNGLAVSLLPLMAYVTANWVHFQIFISLYGLCFTPLLAWWLPETVPWLHANNRLEEAEEVLLRAGKWNNVKFTKPIFTSTKKNKIFTENNLTIDLEKLESDADLKETTLIQSTTNEIHIGARYSAIELFRNRYLLRHLALGISIFADNLGYYGATYMSSSLSVNRFMSGFLVAIVEIPASILAYISVHKFGRKRPSLLFAMIAAASAFICALTSTYESSYSSLSYATMTFNIAFKLFMSSVLGIISIYLTELFPTNLRTQAVGICWMMGRAGGILASYSSYFVELSAWGVYIGLGLVTLLGNLPIIQLPETARRALPETIDDIKEWHVKAPKKHERDKSILA